MYLKGIKKDKCANPLSNSKLGFTNMKNYLELGNIQRKAQKLHGFGIFNDGSCCILLFFKYDATNSCQ